MSTRERVARDLPPLAGRDAELAAITEAVAAVAAGGTRALVLTGEAGIGKTALLARVREQAVRAGLTVLDGCAAEHEQEIPFATVVDALDAHVEGLRGNRLDALGADRVAELAAVLPAVARGGQDIATTPAAAGAAERFRYHRALAALLGLLARERPVALVLDDLHWADDATVELVLHLLRRPPAGPHLLVLASRPLDPVPRLLDAARGSAVVSVLELRTLDDRAADALLGAVGDPALRARIRETAAGNPLYLEELARVADPGGALPATIVAAVQLEAAALPPASRALLDGAAVAGDPFDPELAAAAAGLQEDALVPLDRLVRADLVRPLPSGRGFRFRHPLVRRAVYDGAAAGWRLGAHERAARMLAARGAGAGVRAVHVERCARPGDEEAIAVLAAAAQACAETTPGTAARWYRTALALVPAGARERRLGLLVPLATAFGDAGRLPACRDALQEAITLLPEPHDPMRLALIAACAGVEVTLGRTTEARRRVETALADLPDDVDVVARITLEVELASVGAVVLDAAVAREHGERALALGADGALAGQAAAIAALGALWEGDAETAVTLGHRATATLRALDDSGIVARPEASYYAALVELMLDRYEDGERTAARGLEAIRAGGQGRFLVGMALVHAMACSNLGRLDASLASAELGYDAAQVQGLDAMRFYACWMLAVVHADRDERAPARAAELEARVLAERLEHNLIYRAGLVNLATLYVEEDPERCIREATEAAGPRLEQLDHTWATYAMLAVLRACVALGRLAEAEQWLELLRERADRLRLPYVAVRPLVGEAAILLARGEAARAAAVALEAADRLDALGSARDRFVAREIAGRALAASGDREGAVRELRAVVDEATAIGASRHRSSAARHLRRLGVRVAAPVTGPGGVPADGSGIRPGLEELTAREREIAELVASGASNKQVAATVFVSEKTVEAHLSRVYAKLGVRGRTELAAQLRTTERSSF